MRSLIAIISTFILTSLFCVSSFAQSCGSGGGATVCLSATGTSAAINLSWTVTGTISSVQVYRDTDSNPNGRSRIATVNSNARSYTDTTAQAGTQYWYWIKFNAGGGSYNSGAATASLASSCAGTAITPYIHVNGVWQLTSNVQISPGTEIKLGPQPWGIWSWSGCGLSGSEREQTFTPTSFCTAIAVYTNACGATTSHSFNISASIGNNWANAKIGGGGYVPGLILHPATPNLIYARTDIGGAYRWNPTSSEWIAITDGFGASEGFYHGTESMAIDPNDDSKVYMSTGMYVNGGNGRLYISSDRGDHWSHVELPFPVGSNNQGRAIGERMMVDPNKPSIVFYGSRTAGLWKSTDSGVTWGQVTSLSSYQIDPSTFGSFNSGSPMGVQFVLFDTATKGSGTATQAIYVGVAPDYAAVAGLPYNIYKSTNGGASWTGVVTPVMGYHIPHVARAADGMLYVAFTMGAGPGANGPGRLYKFDGTNWTLLRSVDPTQWTSYGYGGLSVYGSGATTKIALGVTNSWGNWEGIPVVEFSEDAGATWREISGNKPHTPAGGVSGWIDDVEIDPFNPDRLLHVHGGGVWGTNNASAVDPSWNEMIDGIEETAPIEITTPPAGAPYVLLNSSWDVGTFVHTSLQTTPTRQIPFGNGVSVDVAWSDSSYIASIGAQAHGASTAPAGAYSTNSGQTWNVFASYPPDATSNLSGESNIAVTSPGNLVWAVANRKPYYSTDNGNTWVATNLPMLEAFSVNRSYHVAADRKNPSRVYAYDHGGSWWGSGGKFYYSIDGGHTFTQSTDPTLTLRANYFHHTSLEVNPNVEGEVWMADGNSLYRSTNGGVTWEKLTAMASVWGSNESWKHPELFGANTVALGKPAPGSAYSAAVYMVGTINGVQGLYRSDDMGVNWARINDDDHQFGGVGRVAADQNIYGRVYISGGGRGVLYNY